MIATMIKSGVPVVQALEIIGSGNKNPRMQKLVGSIRSDIENGSSIYDALSKHPVQFDELYRNLVRAGESAGVLEVVLDTIATYKENIEALKGKIKKALFYPAMVMAVGSEEHTSELQSLMRISYAVFCMKKKTPNEERD